MDDGKLEDEFLLLAQNHTKWQCAVCLDLLFKPVYCPKKCNKATVLCEECMDRALQNNQHRCPICNCKLIRWNRKRENFYHKKMWDEMKTQIPGLCKLRARSIVCIHLSFNHLQRTFFYRRWNECAVVKM